MTEIETISDIQELKTKALQELKFASSLDDLNRWRVAYLGRNGELTQILRTLSSLPPEHRRQVGAVANQAKHLLEKNLSRQNQALKADQVSNMVHEDQIDVTLPGWPAPQGGLHPTTRIVREICKIFTNMGFDMVEGPEVEWDHYNFEMLNIPKDHPARDMWSTLWIDPSANKRSQPMLLRTHTSPMQARFMERAKPPIRVIVPGKCYRYEATDATHEWHFFQIEGLAVDKGITFANLKGTLYEFVRRFFGEERRIRFRCDFFPFVEPGVDMSIDCFKCNGAGCNVCSDTGWIEILGAGMVHPKVLEAVNYDPDIYTGFAFGMGVERIAMLKYGIEDIRLFYSNDIRFLRQF